MWDFFKGNLHASQLSALELASVLMSIFVIRSLIFAGLGSLWTQHSSWAQRHRVLPEAIPWQNIARDIIHGAQILVFDMVTFVIAHKIGFLKLDDFATPLAETITFLIFFVWLEIFFYYSHRWMHQPRWFWIHRHHHESRATNPWSSLAFSFTERSVLMISALIIPGIFSQWIAIPTAGISGYFLFNYIFNVFGHLNVEVLPPLYVKTLGRLTFTTSFHALHHMRFRGHYGLYTRFLDRWHGTEFSDYEDVHARAYRGSAKVSVAKMTSPSF